MTRIPYAVVLYDQAGAATAVLENATTPTYSRAKNSADQVRVSVPRLDPKADLVEIGMRFEIIRRTSAGEVVEESGFVSEHGYDGDWYVINGFTEEIVLGRYLTPAQFGYPIVAENPTLDQFVENLQSGYVVERVKGNWVRGGTSTNGIDTTSNPEFVILARQISAPDEYRTSGWIALTFEKTSEQTWERFRWVSDYDPSGVVTSTVQWRTATTEAGLSAEPWTAEQPGSDIDVQGIVVSSQSDNFLEVRVNLYTTDTEVSPVLHSLEVIKREPSDITSVDYPVGASSVVVPALSADNASFLDLMIDVCENVGWEFRVFNGELSVAESFGVDRTNSYTLVAS